MVSNLINQKAAEADHLLAARRGDSHRFGELTEPYRRELQVHCYRILGSLHEAEDMVQETFLRAWKRLGTYEGRASFRSWLYKIATNACLDFLDSKRTRRLLPNEGVPAADPHLPIVPHSSEFTWLEPFPDEWLADESALNPEAKFAESESISLAFLTALQALPPRQRAVLILRDVLDFSAIETAEVLELTVSAVNSILHRARVTMSKQYHKPDLEDSTPAQTDQRTRWLLDHFIQAWERADVDGLVALLKEDAIFAMPPSPSWYRGRSAIGKFAAGTIFADEGMFTGSASGRWRLVRTNANGSPAFAIYQRAGQGEYLPFGIIVLDIEKGALNQIISFLDPSLPTLIGLPDSLSS